MLNFLFFGGCMKAWLASAVCFLSALPLGARAAAPADDQYPSRPLRFVIPFPAGGSTDLIARIVGQRLSGSIGLPVIVDNRPGAAGLLAAEIVARAAPNGYTVLMHTASYATTIAIMAKVPFDPFKDITPITQLVTSALLIAVNANSPMKTMQDLISTARAKPGSLNYGSVGVGSINHLSNEVLNRMAKINTVHVPFKGAAAAITGIFTGEVQMFLGGFTDIVPQIKAGRLRPLAVTSAGRSPFLPDVPTIAESGVPNYVVPYWSGLFGTGGTPRSIILRLNQEVGKILQSQEVRDRFALESAEPAPTTPEAFGKLVRDQIDFWRQIAREAEIKPE